MHLSPFLVRVQRRGARPKPNPPPVVPRTTTQSCVIGPSMPSEYNYACYYYYFITKRKCPFFYLYEAARYERQPIDIVPSRYADLLWLCYLHVYSVLNSRFDRSFGIQNFIVRFNPPSIDWNTPYGLRFGPEINIWVKGLRTDIDDVHAHSEWQFLKQRGIHIN